MAACAFLLLLCGFVEMATPKAATWLHSNELLDAALAGDENAVDEALQKGAEVDYEHGDSRSTALGAAASRGHAAVVLRLVQAGAKMDHHDVQNYLTALHYASRAGHTDTVRVLLDAGAPVDFLSLTYYSPLMLAAIDGHVDVVRLLLAANATVDLETHLNTTALFFAAGGNQVTTTRLLLAAGADVHQQDKDGNTVLYYIEQNAEKDDDGSWDEMLKVLRMYESDHAVGFLPPMPTFPPFAWEVDPSWHPNPEKRHSLRTRASEGELAMVSLMMIGSSAAIGLLETILRWYATRRPRVAWIWPGCLVILAIDALFFPYTDSQPQWIVQSTMLTESLRISFTMALLFQLLPTDPFFSGSYSVALFYSGDRLVAGQFGPRLFFAGAAVSAAGLLTAKWPRLVRFLGPPELLAGIAGMRVLEAAAGMLGAINEGRVERGEPEMVPHLPSYALLRVPASVLLGMLTRSTMRP